MGSPHLRPRALPLRHGEMGSLHLPPCPLPLAEWGKWGLEKKNDGNLPRHGCVLGARAAGLHSDGWNRVAPGSALVLRSALGGPHLPPSPLPLPQRGRGRGRWEPLTFALVHFFSPTGRGSQRLLGYSMTVSSPASSPPRGEEIGDCSDIPRPFPRPLLLLHEERKGERRE